MTTIARLALAAALAVVATTTRGGAADTQSRIQSAYDHRCHGTVTKDMAVFSSSLSPRFAAVDLDRNTRSRAEVVAAVQSPPQGAIFESCAVFIRGMQAGGNTATVLETQTITGTLVDVAGTAKPFVHVEDSIDTWAISPKLLETASSGAAERLTVDGLVVLDRGILASPSP